MIKKLLSLAAILTVMGFANNATAQAEMQDASVTITNATSRLDLVEIRNDLIEKGIDFRYRPEFNQQRILTAIEIDIVCSNGETGTFQTALASDDQKAMIVWSAANGLCVGICEE